MYKLIDGHKVINPDGTESYRVWIMGTTTPVSLTITGADVEGLADDAVLAASSVLFVPGHKYVAYEDGVFTEEGGAST